MKPAVEEMVIETLQGIDTGMGYLITGMQKLVEESALSLKYNMVTANNGIPHMIGGYVHGRTSNGDPFVLLYSNKDGLKHKITRVYEQSFSDLPWFIETNNVSDTAQDGNPNKETAMKLGIYRTCDWFEIATIPGKDTQMGPEQRFYMTIKLYNQKSEAPSISDRQPIGTTADNNQDTFSNRQETIDTFVPPTVDHGQAEAKLNAIVGEGLAELTEPYTYQDGTALADSPQLHSIFKAYWKHMKEIAATGAALRSWYGENKELVNA